MKFSDFDYYLPKNLIAQAPARPRDHSRLLVLDKRAGTIKHKHFYDIIDFLKEGDVLVLNNSKVMPARLLGRKKETGGKIEVFLLNKKNLFAWNCLLGGHGIKEDLEIKFGKKLAGKIIKNNLDGTWEIKFIFPYEKVIKILEKIGKVPLPPYIKKSLTKKDKNDYQTIYADEKKLGSVAAPTAGFHFTSRLLNKIKKMGVTIEFVTLYVGMGTFMPVKADDIKKHKIHKELVEIKKNTAKKIIDAKRAGRRIIAVGTTSARALEGCLAVYAGKKKVDFKELKANIDIFIYPGYKFKIVDVLITNFHLPKSTLLMLVSALAGKENINKAYRTAVKKKYRFYSYGDSMIIH